MIRNLSCRSLGACVLLLAAAACDTVRTVTSLNPLSSKSSRPKLTEHELTARLRALCTTANTLIQRASRQIVAESTDPDRARIATYWKIDSMTACRRLLEEQAPLRSFLELWAHALRGRDFFGEGEGRDVFVGASQYAADAYASVAERAAEVAADVFPKEVLPRVQKAVTDFAREHPIKRHEFTSARVSLDLSLEDEGTFDWVLRGPTRFVAFATGVDETAKAVNRVAQAADRFTYAASQLPMDTALQLELISHTLQDNSVVKASIANLDSLTESVARLTTTTEELPARVQQVVSKTLEEIDAKQAGVRQTLTEARSTATQLDATLAGLDRAAKSLEATGKAWEPTAREIRLIAVGDGKEKEPKPVEEPAGRPFDILDYAKTADALTKTAGELRAVLSEFRGLVGSDDVPKTLENIDSAAKAAIDHTGARAVDLTDHAFWRAVQLIGVVLLAALVYRFATLRMAARSPGGRPSS